MAKRGLSYLRYVLDTRRHRHPAVHALLVDRDLGAWKVRVGERTDRYSDRTFEAFGRPVHR